MSNLSFRFGTPLSTLRKAIEDAAQEWAWADGAKITSLRESHVLAPCVWITAPPRAGVAPSDAVYMHCHGGAYYRGSSAVEAALCSHICRFAGVRCFSVDYRRAPDEGVFPAAVDDAHAAYRWLTSGDGGGVRPHNVVVGGLSAGGGLALALLIRLRDAGERLPSSAVAMSPWTDLTMSGASYKGPLSQYGPTASYLHHWAKQYLAGADPRHPEASPMFADLSGLPPILVQVGGHEAMLDDSAGFCRRASSAGVEVRLEVYAEQRHAFHNEASTNRAAADAVEQISDFMREHAGAGSVSSRM